MDESALVETELNNIHRTRNRIGYLPNFCALLFQFIFNVKSY